MLEEIEIKIAEIQKSNKALSNQIEENARKEQNNLDEIFLDVIGVLDAFQREESIIADKKWNESEDSQKAIKRLLNAKKKVTTMLEKYNVTKMEFPDGLSVDDMCTVVDAEPDMNKVTGTIISIQKDGFQREGHTLRRAEVIIVKN